MKCKVLCYLVVCVPVEVEASCVREALNEAISTLTESSFRRRDASYTGESIGYVVETIDPSGKTTAHAFNAQGEPDIVE